VSRFFKLEGKVAVPVSSGELMQWLSSDPNRSVQLDEFTSAGVSVRVSTSFLMGVNHRWVENAEPLLFETLVFGGAMDQSQWRYSTWEQAEAGHQVVIEQLLREMPTLTRVVTTLESPRLTRYERILRDICQSPT